MFYLFFKRLVCLYCCKMARLPWALPVLSAHPHPTHHLAEQQSRTGVCLLLVQRLWRWTNSKPAPASAEITASGCHRDSLHASQLSRGCSGIRCDRADSPVIRTKLCKQSWRTHLPRLWERRNILRQYPHGPIPALDQDRADAISGATGAVRHRPSPPVVS